MKYWGDCKTVEDLWEAARTQHLIICITRSIGCSIEQCKTCGWNAFDEEEWKPRIEEELKKLKQEAK